MQEITPRLWYATQAEEAAAFDATVFHDSRVVRATPLPGEAPGGPPGSIKVVEFELFGQPFMAITAGPLDPFNHAVSFVLNCDDQAEIACRRPSTGRCSAFIARTPGCCCTRHDCACSRAGKPAGRERAGLDIYAKSL